MCKGLVSVVVLSYNSELTISETLDSILAQNYNLKNIEIIISDDCSKDKTNEVVYSWVLKNGSEFNNVKHIINDVNQGVSINCNNAWKEAKGDWIKTIAADDLLTESCIESFMQYVDKNKDIRICFSRMKQFSSDGEISKVLPAQNNLVFFNLSAEKQYKYLCCNSFTIAPASFISKELLDEVGYKITQYRNFEDLPLWVYLTRNGVKLHLLNQVNVLYRVHNSISNGRDRLYNPSFQKELELFYKNEIFPYLRKASPIHLYERKVDFLTRKIQIVLGNKRGSLSTVIMLISFILRPFSLYCRIRAKF